VLNRVQPAELYHLAGQSHVGLSFEIPETTCEFTAMGTLRLLEILRDLPEPPRFFHATSSEIFGRPAASPQNEDTPIAPINPYGCAKAFATQMVRVYRESHGLFAVNGILYNHESSRRGENFVTRKICHAAAAIKLGRQHELVLGDTSAQRDWGHARDYVRGMWMALNHDTPDDYVFATGILHRVQDVIETAFAAVDLDWSDYVRFRPPLPASGRTAASGRRREQGPARARLVAPDLVHRTHPGNDPVRTGTSFAHRFSRTQLRSCLNAKSHSSPASPVRTEPIWLNSC
jgi:GDPmannose 4,6-dehydratase